MQISLCSHALALLALLGLAFAGPVFYTVPKERSNIQLPTLTLRPRRAIDPGTVALSKRHLLDYVSLNAMEDAGYGWTCCYNQLLALTPSGIVAQHLERFYEDALSGALISQSFREATTNIMVVNLGYLSLRLDSNQPIAGDFLIGFLQMIVG